MVATAVPTIYAMSMVTSRLFKTLYHSYRIPLVGASHLMPSLRAIWHRVFNFGWQRSPSTMHLTQLSPMVAKHLAKEISINSKIYFIDLKI
jgi:hypothetical protein